MPPTCRFLGSEDVKPSGTHPVAAGGFADIWEAIYDGRKVALKSYRCYMRFNVAQAVERFCTEVRVCGLLHSTEVNAIPLVGFYSTEAHPFALVYEYMDGLDLKQYLSNEPGARKLKLLTNIAQSLSGMVNLGIIHRDLRAANILVDKDGTPRIAGLGNVRIPSHSTARAAESEIGIDRLGRSRVEPPLALSPNVTGPTQPTEASEMYYAFGVMAFEILTGHPPFFELPGIAARNAMMTGRRPPRPNRPEVSDRLWAMVERCLHVVPSQRMSFREAVHLLETELRNGSSS
ncbi:kinase-like domain-containing protein [Thelephora terrestris]|uniref:Kinase-like domain-containing protein n=1 Tax=Thelephora terrestris TaxID=56493 RepID=A0A9P6LAU9_9AGAM|nr:kinase-like domain-containing protein [Thelephora terrestris]